MQKKKISVGIIGTGNIGTDLLLKIQQSDVLECTIFTGKNPDSLGIKKAKQLKIPTSLDSINEIIKNPKICEIVFDATSANSHYIHAPILKKLNKFTIDLTPSRIGKMCIPVLNLNDCLNKQNINMVTCGGQAMIPIAQAIMKIHPDTKYIEIIGSISSKSAGIGTRNNIDEYTQTTRESLREFTGVKNSKAIIILNPAEPPINMHNTLFAEIENPNLNALKKEINKVVQEISQYVPGYRLIMGPVFENGKITIMVEVHGSGDYLPKYAGNLDIINCAAIRVAEKYARQKLLTSDTLQLAVNSQTEFL